MDDVMMRVHAIGFDEFMRWDMHILYVYDREDPLRVGLIFQEAGGAVEWREDRHVLMHAVYAFTRAHTHDMLIQPLRDFVTQMPPMLPEDAMVLHMEGVLPDGRVDQVGVIVHREGLRRFLDDTHELIPLGQEPVDVDTALAQLFEDVQ